MFPFSLYRKLRAMALVAGSRNISLMATGPGAGQVLDGRQLFSWDYFRVARQNEAARAADAAACIAKRRNCPLEERMGRR